MKCSSFELSDPGSNKVKRHRESSMKASSNEENIMNPQSERRKDAYCNYFDANDNINMYGPMCLS